MPASVEQLVLMFTDLVDSVGMLDRLGPQQYKEYVKGPHDAMFPAIVARFPGAEIRERAGDSYLAIFRNTQDAVEAALLFHHELKSFEWKSPERPEVRIGIHSGQASIDDEQIVGMVINICSRLMSLGTGGQTLLTERAFDDAREFVRRHPAFSESEELKIRWECHGTYRFQGDSKTYRVFEVGADGVAPFIEPPDTGKARRIASTDEEGPWRPGVGQPVESRPEWILDCKIDEGGFGEVWLAHHAKLPPRVFKFCFDTDRLRSFKREAAIFRVISENLGRRNDIAEVLDFKQDSPPYFVASQYLKAGNLKAWAESQGGLQNVSLETKVRFVAEIARTLGDAHEIGIIHRDIKPQNILMRQGKGGLWHPTLSDFGISAITKPEVLEDLNLTIPSEDLQKMASSRTGTGMYKPPEALKAHFAADTVKGMKYDVYQLGVLLYQLLVSDFDLPLTFHARERIEDELLCEDVSMCLADVDQRLASAGELATRLERLPQRRQQIQDLREAEENKRRAEESRRQAEQLRRKVRRTVAALGVSVVVLAVVAAMGWVTYRALGRAEETLGIARNAIDEYFVEVSEDPILGEPGMRPLKVGLLNKAKVYSLHLLKDREDDPDLQADVARAHFRLGVIAELTDGPQEAIKHYGRAEKIQAGIAASGDSQQALANTLNATGRALQKLGGKDDEAELYYQRAYELRKKTASEDNLQAQRLLANSLMNLGQLKQKRIEQSQRAEGSQGVATAELEADCREAERLLTESQAVRQRQGQPAGPLSAENFDWSHSQASDLYRDYGHCALNLANLAITCDDLAAALGHATTAINVFSDLSESFANRPDYQLQLARAHRLIGIIHLEQGDLRAAIAALLQAQPLQETLVARFPDSPEYRFDLAQIRMDLGQGLIAGGDTAAGVLNLARAEWLLTTLAADHPDNEVYVRHLELTSAKIREPSMRENLTAVADNLAEIAASYGQLQETNKAKEAAELAVSLRTVQIGALVNDDERRVEYAIALTELANLHVKLGEVTAASVGYQAALEILRQPMNDPADLERVTEIEMSIADMVEDLNYVALEKSLGEDLGLATASFELAVAFQRVLAGAHPEDADYALRYAVSLADLATLHLQSGDSDAARTDFESSLAEVERLNAADANNLGLLYQRAILALDLGNLEFTTGNVTPAIERFHSSVGLLRTFLQQLPEDETSYRAACQNNLEQMHEFFGKQAESNEAFLTLKQGVRELLDSMTTSPESPDNESGD